MVLPHCLTFVRAAVVGVIGKTRESYPWPSRGAMIAVGVCVTMLCIVLRARECCLRNCVRQEQEHIVECNECGDTIKTMISTLAAT